MKNFKVSSRVLSVVTGSVITLCGCSSNSSSLNVSSGSDVSSSFDDSCTTTVSINDGVVTSTSMSTNDSVVTSSVSSSDSVVTSSVSSGTTQASSQYYNELSADYVVLDHFSSLSDGLERDVYSPDFLDKCKFYFISCIDFLFFDGSINGYKFSDLTDTAKEQLLSDISYIDSFISLRYPNYKEVIYEGASSVYSDFMDVIEAGSKNIKDFSYDKLGEERYSKIKEYKDLFVEQTVDDWGEFKDIIGSAYDTGKSKIKDKYEDFKGQN